MSITSVAVQDVIRAICCPRLQCDLGAVVAVSRYKVDARQLLSTVTVVSSGRGGNPGLTPWQLLSNVQRIKAKTVTSLLILLSVLAVGRLKLSGYNRGQIGSGVHFLFIRLYQTI